MKILPELLDYDIFPKVVSEKKETLITIKPLGGHAHFEEREYTLHILGLEDGAIRNYKNRKNLYKMLVKVDDDKCIRFKFSFPKEQMYCIRLIKPDGKEFVELCVYAVAPDLSGRYPFMGDLHFHTCYSDGKQAPEIAVANCRKIGYDFMAITDHERYYPSLLVKEFYKDVPIDLNLVPGEELTRFSMAQREIGLASGEPPVSKGYPPSVYAEMPKLLERAGNSSVGSITGLYTVLVDGDDFNEPITDTARSILDGHIMLSRKLGHKNHYPAIDVLQSISRVMSAIATKEHKALAGKLKNVMATYNEAEDLINIGAYKNGSNQDIDYAIRKIRDVNAFLRQDTDEKFLFEEEIRLLENLFKN